MSSSEGVWASLVFKQYDTHMDFMGREFGVGYIRIGSSHVFSLISAFSFSGNCRLQHAAHLGKYIGTSSNILMPISTATYFHVCNSLRGKGYLLSKLQTQNDIEDL